MNKQLGKIGTARREIHGKACPFCGGCMYQLVLRAAGDAEEFSLVVRCTRCHRPRRMDEDFGTVLWM
jgi:hypothetical protein